MPSATWIIALCAAAALAVTATAVPTRAADKDKTPASPLDFTMDTIDGKPKDLNDYRGKVVLMVNVASKCGYTPQYKPLQNLHKKYADQGLAILGFPANEFGHQEPGGNSEIKEFCQKNYGVDFDMFSKVVVKGDGICPLYEYLTSEATDPEFAGEIKWNFTKFLIDRNGKIIARFESKVSPDSDDVVEKIEAALAEKVE